MGLEIAFEGRGSLGALNDDKIDVLALDGPVADARRRAVQFRPNPRPRRTCQCAIPDQWRAIAGRSYGLWAGARIPFRQQLAKALADALSTADPAHRAAYQQNLSRFEQSVQPIQANIAIVSGMVGRLRRDNAAASFTARLLINPLPRQMTSMPFLC